MIKKLCGGGQIPESIFFVHFQDRPNYKDIKTKGLMGRPGNVKEIEREAPGICQGTIIWALTHEVPLRGVGTQQSLRDHFVYAHIMFLDDISLIFYFIWTGLELFSCLCLCTASP